MLTTVFVYGTLLKGLRYHHILKDCQFLGKKIGRGLQMYDLGPFPACVFTNNYEHTVKGELYAVDEDVLKRLDILEGYPEFYNRIELKWINSPSWVYILNNKDVGSAPLIESGDWREHVSRI